MNAGIYYPVLRAKGGEFIAVGRVRPQFKRLIRPIFDVPGGGDVDENLSLVTVNLAGTWGVTEPLYLDLSRHDPDSNTANGESLVARLFKNARQAHLRAIPVAGPVLDRQGKTGAYLGNIADIAHRDGLGAAIRIPLHDLLVPDDLEQVINQVQRAIALDDAECDVILDAGPVEVLPEGHEDAEAALSKVLPLAVQSVADRLFRTLVVCASSIPRHAKCPAPSAPYRVANLEYQIWSQLLNSKNLRHVRFGDFGARFANQSDKKGGGRPPARVHLCTRSRHTLFVDGETSYRQLAMAASTTTDFADQVSAWGKYAVRDASWGADNEGNAMDWVARDTHMHLETMAHAVEERIREISGPLPEQEQSESFPHDQAYLPFSTH